MISSAAHRPFATLVLLLSSLLSFQALAAEPINTLERSGLFGYDPSGVAIRGADTVAYFTQMQYVPGSDEFTTQWNGATWKFSSKDHLDLFIADPEKYAPQYGGYCAFGVAQDYLVKIEPEAWSIVDGKLYLNYSVKVQEEWEEDIPGFIAQANKNFTGLLAE
ncbi:MAG: YHS domain-containing (seleno)protein [Pseudomonadota bacterium]